MTWDDGTNDRDDEDDDYAGTSTPAPPNQGTGAHQQHTTRPQPHKQLLRGVDHGWNEDNEGDNKSTT
jgi:hypothetical protein